MRPPPARPPGWGDTLQALRDAVRAGEIDGSTAEMAAQVRWVIARGTNMSTGTALNYKPESLITAVEFPMGWGDGKDGIKACCEHHGLKTVQDVYEFAQRSDGLQKLARWMNKAAKVNFLVATVKKVCERHDSSPGKPSTRKPATGRDKFNDSDAEFARKAARQKPAVSAARFPNYGQAADLKMPEAPPNSFRFKKRWPDTRKRMNAFLASIARGDTRNEAAKAAGVTEEAARLWGKKYDLFRTLYEKAQRNASSTQDAAPATDKTPGKPDTPPQDDVDDDQISVRLKVDKLELEVEGDDPDTADLSDEALAKAEPFPPFPEPTFENEDDLPEIEDGPADATVFCPDCGGGVNDAGRRIHSLHCPQRETDRIDRRQAVPQPEFSRAVVAEPVHPFIEGLVQSLPPAGSVWGDSDRDDWLRAATCIFRLMYRRPAEMRKGQVMAVEFICDGCGKRRPGVPRNNAWFKPHNWYERGDDDGIQDACSRECIDKIAEKTGKTGVVLPF